MTSYRTASDGWRVPVTDFVTVTDPPGVWSTTSTWSGGASLVVANAPTGCMASTRAAAPAKASRRFFIALLGRRIRVHAAGTQGWAGLTTPLVLDPGDRITGRESSRPSAVDPLPVSGRATVHVTRR